MRRRDFEWIRQAWVERTRKVDAATHFRARCEARTPVDFFGASLRQGLAASIVADFGVRVLIRGWSDV
jgi:hypothetical protein